MPTSHSARLLKSAALFLCLAATSAQAGRGAVNADITEQNIEYTICVPGYGASVQPTTKYTNGVKRRLLLRAGLAPSQASKYELYYIIPLALGGHPRKTDNLDLQPLADTKRKDRLEKKLQCLVCAGQARLTAAQRQIAADWEAAYHRYSRVKCLPR